jgi:hypothetical protein
MCDLLGNEKTCLGWIDSLGVKSLVRIGDMLGLLSGNSSLSLRFDKLSVVFGGHCFDISLVVLIVFEGCRSSQVRNAIFDINIVRFNELPLSLDVIIIVVLLFR